MGVRVSVQGLHHLDELIAGARAVRSRLAISAGQSLFELEGAVSYTHLTLPTILLV